MPERPSNSQAAFIVFVLRLGITAVLGIVALILAMSAACHVASVRGPQFDVVWGPVDPAVEGATVFVVGTLSGAVALVCGIRIWRAVRSDRATQDSGSRQ